MTKALLLGLILGLSACSNEAQDRLDAPPYLRLADQDDLPTLDPARGYDVASWQFEDLLFSTLVDYDQQGVLQPEAALDWQISADRLRYTFRLRRNIRFTNGRAVTAADFAYAIRRVLAPATKSPGAEFFRGIVGAEACHTTGCTVDGLRVRDAHTLEIALASFDPLFLHKLAMPFAAALPAEAVDKWGEDFSRHPIGSGPFRLEEWKVGQSLFLVRNPDYFIAGVPRLAGVQRLVGVNDELGWFKYEAGQLDIAEIPPAEFPRVVAEPKLAPLLRRVVTLRTQYLGMNCQRPPFDDLRVRRAVNHAVNRTKLLQLINNRGVLAKGILPPGIQRQGGEHSGYAHDPALARRLMHEAGHADGLRTTLWVRLDSLTLRLAQSVQQDLAEIGMEITIKPLAWGSFLDAVKRTDLVPFFLLGWEADFPDASNFLEVLFHSKYIGTNNNTSYSNPTVDALLDEAAHSVEEARRQQLLQQVEAIVLEDAPWAPLYHPVTYQVVSSRVRDYQLHPLRPARLDTARVDSEP